MQVIPNQDDRYDAALNQSSFDGRRRPSAWASPVTVARERIKLRRARTRFRRSTTAGRRDVLRETWRRERWRRALWGDVCLHCQPAPRACPLHGHPDDIPF